MGRIGVGLAAVSTVDVGALLGSWWDEINDSPRWQDGIFYTLCAAYALVSFIALIQLIRIELRVPEYGWTTQKVFHLMNFIVNGVRAIVFGFHTEVFFLRPKVVTWILLDLPGLLFFSTYTLLVLFWAEIYHQARSLPTDKLRVVYISVNAAMYFIQEGSGPPIGNPDPSTEVSGAHRGRRRPRWRGRGRRLAAPNPELNGDKSEVPGRFGVRAANRRPRPSTEVAGVLSVSIIAALGFLLYGGRLFFMLRRFPIESKGRRKKLHEELVSAFDSSNASLDVLYHPVLNLIYYMLVEILPSALVLYILRKLPPKRVSAQYHPIR
ncbi:hypothetical protein CDL15_Pgr010699 [Punica granatum]|uniref:THH1/TOM1/TOM3 domain-containing protein n=1 Tax=Punica granatum TaxID=22663 RepID=A0A218XMZ7_PUNGR|nr:hypothetical protein CDL15_Pgr010699 [Punica granatum]